MIIAGSDSGGGAGIQGDIKTVTALGGYAATAITALTVQNTLGVSAVHRVPEAIVAGQIRAVLDDIGADVIKTGMLVDGPMIHAVGDALTGYDIPLVLDPVMVAKGGAPLLRDDAVSALKTRLIPRAMILTPNVPEAEVLSGRAITTAEDMVDAGKALLDLGCTAVLMKGGHLAGDDLTDWLITADEVARFNSPRIPTRHTHGTGCTLASAIATGVAQGLRVTDAVVRARAYVQGAIAHAPGLGSGHGPLNHAWAASAPNQSPPE
jgi:hydroxymethylpyrimidine/phosphomethylpyrimidine kinase